MVMSGIMHATRRTGCLSGETSTLIASIVTAKGHYEIANPIPWPDMARRAAAGLMISYRRVQSDRAAMADEIRVGEMRRAA